jgi:hypothetical protein
MPVAAGLLGCLGCFAALFSVIIGIWLLTAWADSRRGGDEQGARRAARAAIKAYLHGGSLLLHETPEQERAVRYSWNNERAARPGGAPQSSTWLVTGTAILDQPGGSNSMDYQLVLSWGAGDEYLVQDFYANRTHVHALDGRVFRPDPD